MKKISGYKTTGELIAAGLTNAEILQRCKSGNLIKIKQGLYRSSELFLQNQSFIDVAAALPKGIICMFSALAYYELTVFIPKQVDVALPRITVRPSIVYPPVKMYYMHAEKLNKYTRTVKNVKYHFRIYDIEKTVCDAVKYKNRIGIDIAKEVVKEYLKRKNRNIVKLIEIAKLQRVEKLLTEWLTVLS